MKPQIHEFHRHPAAPWLELRVSKPSTHCFRLHAHDEYSIGIVDLGTASFHHAHGPENVAQHSVVLIEPGCWHACNPELPHNWAYRMLFVNADWLHAQTGTAALTFTQRALSSSSSPSQASAIVDQLCQPLHHAADIAQHTRLLLDFVHQHAEASDIARREAADFPAIRHALQIMHSEPDADTQLASIATRLGMSASQFVRQFKSATGVTPGAYRLNLRINGARRLLADGATLADAAHRMGFADQAHMQRSFKAHHSLTPGNYAQTAAIRQRAA